MKCAYIRCHETYDLTKENAVKKSNKYYHDECMKKINGKSAIRDMYIKRVSETVVMAQLNKVIQNIVDEKNIAVEYLYFALRYAINHNYSIKSPMGLYYLIDNSDIKKAYDKFKLKKQNENAPKIEPKQETEIVFTISPQSKNTWNLFGG